MKTMLAMAAVVALAGVGAARAETVEVTLTGVQARGGHIVTALQTRADFMQPRATASRMLSGDASGVVTFTLEAPAGDYALAVLHDADDNRAMTLADGKPTEGWGYPDGDKLRDKPTFDQVSTRIPSGGGVTRITIPMVYPQR